MRIIIRGRMKRREENFKTNNSNTFKNWWVIMIYLKNN